MELGSRNLGSHCDRDASGVDEFQGGTSAGSNMDGVTDLELAEICRQRHMSVTGFNNKSEFQRGLIYLLGTCISTKQLLVGFVLSSPSSLASS